MSLRRVQLVEDATGEPERAGHVVGVDESGNPTESEGPYVISAVYCPRDRSERLAELLVECGLNPWRNKSRSLSAVLDEPSVQSDRVRKFLERLSRAPVSWSAAFGWQSYSVEERAAFACSVTSKAITGADEPSGKAVLLHDGGVDTYGTSQVVLRKQAAAWFDPSFQSAFCPVYVTSLVDADLTYPEVIAADYVSGYVREVVRTRGNPDGTPSHVVRMRREWREPETSPLSLYRLRTAGASHPTTIQSRVAAWIAGRRPARHDLESDGQYENVVSRLTSGDVQSYLRELA